MVLWAVLFEQSAVRTMLFAGLILSLAGLVKGDDQILE